MLTGLGKFDESFGDDSVGKIVCKPSGNASLFKRDTQNLLGFDEEPPRELCDDYLKRGFSSCHFEHYSC
jgi:hypothetical protein